MEQSLQELVNHNNWHKHEKRMMASTGDDRHKETPKYANTDNHEL